MSSTTTPMNPLLSSWSSTNAYGLPPFGDVSAAHFAPAFEAAMASHLFEATSIATSTVPPTFENTIRALDRAGADLDRVSRVLSHLCASNTTPELQAVELEMAPKLAAHSSRIYFLTGLFERVDALAVRAQTTETSLSPQATRLTERMCIDFVRAGARLSLSSQNRAAEIGEALSTACTKFTQNILADETNFTLPMTAAELIGCPSDIIAAARQAALERGGAAAIADTDAHIVTLSRSLVEPFLTHASRRDLRERAWRAWTRRGELSAERDNIALAKTILELRSEQAALHGYSSFAAYQTSDSMAQNPARVSALLEDVWPRARASAERENAALAAFSTERSLLPEGVVIEAWDRRYIAEKLRSERYDFNDEDVKPYMSLEAMTAALFDVAGELFGLRFVRKDVESRLVYHSDVVVYEVRQTNSVGGEGSLIAIFCADNFARPAKSGGAWMSELRTQSNDDEIVLPIIYNNNNFARGIEGGPTLLSFDDAVTLFHEFGHALHGMLSNSSFKGLAGTSVLRDFVELPSQLYEHWISEPKVLKKHACHVVSGEPLPDTLLAKLKAARKFGLGFATVEYTACAMLDQNLHLLSAEALATLNIGDFEKSELSRIQMPRGITLRHRPAHFSHLFSGSSYAAGYYVYLWAETLDADAFAAFTETGDIFDKTTATLLRKHIYSAGNTVEPGATYRAFRGRDPNIEHMLRKKGLIEE